MAEGVAFDSYWEAGDEFESGAKHCRFTPEGKVIIKDILESQHSLPVHELKRLMQNHTDIMDYIKARLAFLAVLPWDNQVDYGKRHVICRLIGLY